MLHMTCALRSTACAHCFTACTRRRSSRALIAKWSELRSVRADVTKRLEDVRIEGKIGSSLQGEVEIRARGAKYDLLAGLDDDLRFVLITSAATVTRAKSESEEAVLVTPSPHGKCERCWHYRADVGTDHEHSAICARCVANLYGNGEPRRYA